MTIFFATMLGLVVILAVGNILALWGEEIFGLSMLLAGIFGAYHLGNLLLTVFGWA